MRVKQKLLRLPKSEKTPDTDEDAAKFSVEQGLFAIADGVSDRSFSNIWSRLVVEFFIENPLFSNDPFEVEWWLEGVQPRYERAAPKIETLQPLAQEKARAASLCTFSSMRISAVDAKFATAELLGLGDSPILIQRQSGAIETFLIQECSEFGLTPICLPSKMTEFDRSFNQVQTRKISLVAGETVMLATDAIASWILCAPARRSQVESAFQAVAAQTRETWQSFVKEGRSRGEMVDDDSTALILELADDSFQTAEWQTLGSTNSPIAQVMQERRKQLINALQTENWERVAILWGDGKTIQVQKGTDPTPEQLKKAQTIADALAAVRGAIRRWNTKGGDPKEIIGPVWDTHRVWLDNEPSAASLRANLLRQGIITDKLATPSKPEEIPSEPSVAKPSKEDTSETFFAEARQKLADALAQDDDKAILDVLKTYQVYELRLLDEYPDKRSRILRAQNRSKVLDAIATDKELEINAAFKDSGLTLDDFSSEYRTRIETANKLAPRVQEIKLGLRRSDFESIVSAYGEDIVQVQDFSGAERRQIFHAVEVAGALKTLRAALAGGDEQEIARVYQEKERLLLESKKITEQEMEQIKLAQHCVEMPQRVRAAIAADDDLKILESYNEHYRRDFTSFSQAETSRITEAQTRKPATAMVREALSSPDDYKRDERIAKQKQYFDLLEHSNLLKENEKSEFRQAYTRFGRVKNLRQAIDRGDDLEIAKCFEQLEPGTKLPPELRERSELAAARVEAAEKFRRALLSDDKQMTLADAQTIVSNYDANLLDEYPHLAAKERAQLNQAQFIVRTENSLAGDEMQVWYVSHLSKDEWTRLDAQQQERIQNALRIFAARIQLRRATLANNPDLLVKNYDRDLEEQTDLTPDEQETLRQAKTRYYTLLKKILSLFCSR